MRKVASILNSVDSGELMRDSSVFYVKKTQKQRDIEQKKKKNKIAKGGNSETLGQRCSTEVVILKSTWIKTDEMAFVGSKNWTVLDKGSSCSKHSPGMPTQLAK